MAKRRLPKIISPSEAGRLFAHADDGTDRGLRDRLALELLYRAGLRVSEVCALSVRDVEPDGVVRVYDAKGGDGTAYFDPARVVPLLERWLPVRERWLAGAETDRLLVHPGGRPLNSRYVQRLVKGAREAADIRGVCTPHVLRHSFATELIGEGFSLPEVQAALRHRSLTTTAIYLHVLDENLRRKVAGRS